MPTLNKAQLEKRAKELGVEVRSIATAETNKDLKALIKKQVKLNKKNKPKEVTPPAPTEGGKPEEKKDEPKKDEPKKEAKKTEGPSAGDDVEVLEFKYGKDHSLIVCVPKQATLVHGGPVIKEMRHPFGFTVIDSVEIDCRFGAGAGVELHSTQDTPNGKLNTYKIVYEQAKT